MLSCFVQSEGQRQPRFTGSAEVERCSQIGERAILGSGAASGTRTVEMPHAAACIASRGPVARAGKSPANEITRTARRVWLLFGSEWSTYRRVHSVVARPFPRRRSRHAETEVQLGASSEAITGAPAVRAISSRKRKRCPCWRRTSTKAELANAPNKNATMPASMGNPYLDDGWAISHLKYPCGVRR